MNRADARVLVVEDNEQMRNVFRRSLKSLGIGHIDEAPDGLVAVDLLTSRSYDVVISDWAMPHMSGIELVRYARSTPSLQSIPIIIVTAYTTRARVLEAADAGVSAFLSKPFRTSTLEEKLSHYLGQRTDPQATPPVDSLLGETTETWHRTS